MHWESSVQVARRATVGKSVLGWIAVLCLLGSGVFWFSLFVDLLAPPTPWSPQAIQAFLMVVAYTLILPLFWSMLLPSSPAGRLLQKQSWATPGYIAVIAAAIFLSYHAGSILLAWWSVQPTIASTDSALFLTITSLIAAVLVPALSWCVVTPEQWIAQIEQARQVKRIEHAMRMEEAAMRAAYARAVSLLNADLTTLTIAQRRELAGILGSFARTQQHALQSIAASWKDMYGVEAQLAIVPDQELLTGYRRVADLLADGVEAIMPVVDYAADLAANPPAPLTDYVTLPAPHTREAAGETPPVALSPPPSAAPRSQQDATPALSPPSPPSPTPAPPPRSAATRRGLLRYAAEYAAARDELSGTWSVRKLATVLEKPERTARDRLDAWEQAGFVGRGEGRGTFYFTEDVEVSDE